MKRVLLVLASLGLVVGGSALAQQPTITVGQGAEPSFWTPTGPTTNRPRG